jgi:hypothetical protein
MLHQEKSGNPVLDERENFFTDDIEEADGGDHGVGVHLAHVEALVLFLNVLDVKGPGRRSFFNLLTFISSQ